jgi:tRNA(Ile)-lysidine synthase
MSAALSSDIIASLLDRFKPLAHVFIAYSGGVDSHVLLHLCASIAELKNKITAVYVHHGLQAEADFWAAHCQKSAEQLGVDFLLRQVNAQPLPGQSPEEAARNARYSALKPLIGCNDVLLLAQHRDDQLETVLLQLFRGSGLRGLSGMPEIAAFGQGWMLRPLLNVAKQALDTYARAHALNWVEDPSNQRSDYDRNFLRNEIVPLLKQRWPALDKTVVRSARHCANAQVLVSEMAEGFFSAVLNPDDDTLSIHHLQLLDPLKQALVIRQWFQAMALKMPAQALVERIFQEVIGASASSDPVLSAPGYCIRRYRDKLYCLKQGAKQAWRELHWPPEQSTLKITDDRCLHIIPSATGIAFEQWRQAVVTVRFRRGGEKIRLPGRAGHHALKNLFQEAGIPPWERECLPLIYLDDQLAAVAGYWISAEFYDQKADGCIRLVWRKPQ